jgi:site-specific recombinase XerD
MSKPGKRHPSNPRPIPVAVDEAVKAYLGRRKSDGKTTQGTVETHRKRLNYLVEYCELEEIEHICDLRGHDIEQYREWRKIEATEKVDVLAPKTIHEHMKMIRVFISAMESMEYVAPGMAERVYVPDIVEEDETSDEILEYDRAEEILSHVTKAESGQAEEVVWRLFVRCGLILSSLHSIDKSDVKTDVEVPHIKLRNRSEAGTKLKNRNDSERRVFISEETAEVIGNHLQYSRCGQRSRLSMCPRRTHEVVDPWYVDAVRDETFTVRPHWWPLRRSSPIRKTDLVRAPRGWWNGLGK